MRSMVEGSVLHNPSTIQSPLDGPPPHVSHREELIYQPHCLPRFCCFSQPWSGAK
jgi:hypothetical protein